MDQSVKRVAASINAAGRAEARANPEAAVADEKREATLKVLLEMSGVLNTGLDRETLAILLALIEQGVNAEALAAVVNEMRREAEALGK